MKLIYITNVRIPTEKAHGYQIGKMCEEFSGRGAIVELWVPNRKNFIKDDIFSFYGLKNNFKIVKINSFDFYKYWKYLGKLSFWLQSLWFMLGLIFIKTDKNAIIYTREAEIGWIFRLRSYWTVYEAHNWPNKNRLYKFLIGRGGKNNKIVVITKGLKDLFLKNNWPENKILVAADGVDLEKFDINLNKEQARSELNLPGNKKIVLYIGHLYEWKGAQDLADAAALLENNFLTVFIGGVAGDAKIFKEKNKAAIGVGKVAVYPHQSRSLMPRWLKAADILILPNKSREKISSHFTSPLKLFEYMASGAPIIASDLPSLREVLNERNCLFFKPDDAKDLVAKIILLSEDQETAEKIAKQAYFDVKKYTWEERANNIINFMAEN